MADIPRAGLHATAKPLDPSIHIYNISLYSETSVCIAFHNVQYDSIYVQKTLFCEMLGNLLLLKYLNEF